MISEPVHIVGGGLAGFHRLFDGFAGFVGGCLIVRGGAGAVGHGRLDWLDEIPPTATPPRGRFGGALATA